MPLLPTDPRDILHYPNAAWKDKPWHQALDKGDTQGAIDAFVREVRTGRSRVNLEHSIPNLYRRWMGREVGFSGGHHLDPDMVAEQRYIGAYGYEHTFEGEIDWLFDPTATAEYPTREWQVQLNRHYQWIPLADKYKKTRDQKYANAFESELRSWVRQCPRPDDNGMGLPGTWRLIEVGIRSSWTWPYAFEMFRDSEHVSDEAYWLMICALHEHGMHLLLWPTKRNFKTMEANGLTHVGVMFPEFRMGATFHQTGLDRVIAEFERQVYPDGTQDELAPSYGMVALSNLYSAVLTAMTHQPYGFEVPPRILERTAEMAEALGLIANPNGDSPPIHDSPEHSLAGLYDDFAQHIDADRFGEYPWLQDRADLLEWAGWSVMHRDGRYCLLDAGPWGTGHQHADAMQLMTFAHDRWLLIDPGKPMYNNSPKRGHMRSSRGHNVVIMDSSGHNPLPRKRIARQPFAISQSSDSDVWATAAKRWASISSDDGRDDLGRFWHERVVFDVPDFGWLVVDRMKADDGRPHSWSWLWHTGAERIDISDDKKMATIAHDDGPGLLIQPVGDALLKPTVYKGKTDVPMFGWRETKDQSEPVPCPMLVLASEPYLGPMTMFTLLIPSADASAEPVSVINVDVDAGTKMLLDVETSDGPLHLRLTGDDAFSEAHYTLPDGRSGAITFDDHTFGEDGDDFTP